MIVWVLYDIEKDKSRNKIAKLCKQYGLYRVQFSVFLGTVSANEKDELKLAIEAHINTQTDKVYIFPMNKSELKETILLGQAFDQKLITDEIKTLFI